MNSDEADTPGPKATLQIYLLHDPRSSWLRDCLQIADLYMHTHITFAAIFLDIMLRSATDLINPQRSA